MITHKFTGGPQFDKALRSLDLSKAKGVKVQMLKKAAEPMRETAERLAPLGDEAPHIVDHFVVQALSRVEDEDFGGKRGLEGDEAVVAVGASKDFFYDWFIEYGTAPHGKHPGTPARPHLRPAFDQNREAAIKSVQDGIWDYVRKTAERSVSGRTL